MQQFPKMLPSSPSLGKALSLLRKLSFGNPLNHSMTSQPECNKIANGIVALSSQCDNHLKNQQLILANNSKRISIGQQRRCFKQRVECVPLELCTYSMKQRTVVVLRENVEPQVQSGILKWNYRTNHYKNGFTHFIYEDVLFSHFLCKQVY